MQTGTEKDESLPRISPVHSAVLWFIFFLICMGLGYPTLNRYDPRTVPGLYDTRAYYAMVTGGSLQSDQTDLSHRVLVPLVAKPFLWLANGHLHTWDPVFFALLISNSLFIATTAFLLLSVGCRITKEYPVALIAALLYLTDFAVANFNLSGYVDSAVNCMMMAVVWTLLVQRWWLLPVWGVLGAFSKETFLPLATVLAIVWWFTSYRRGTVKLTHLAWIALMGAIGAVTVTILMMRGTHPYTPLSFAVSRWQESGAGLLYLSGLIRCLLAREFLFVFVWLLPLGLWRLNRLPKGWVAGTACAALLALAMGAYDDALGNATRAVFSVCGPMLALSCSLFLFDFNRLTKPCTKTPE